ncbi:uncharacterized protein BJ212DRAFT_1333727 [Suillus subaureus]|uniref:Uncharacterized protein n=1 Tax=Suillus subaureus TaxID=48587 RepID=A0A9P7EHW4_9AGAM|nr:uncharacterized protein BJ212DRAFT_1333727 [Suillus subaureus]KAG1821804.1 hypothetical protein BJ212DRAFT_1333727 [Suillus subaureus]
MASLGRTGTLSFVHMHCTPLPLPMFAGGIMPMSSTLAKPVPRSGIAKGCTDSVIHTVMNRPHRCKQHQLDVLSKCHNTVNKALPNKKSVICIVPGLDVPPVACHPGPFKSSSCYTDSVVFSPEEDLAANKSYTSSGSLAKIQI